MSVHPPPTASTTSPPTDHEDELGSVPLEGSGFEGQTPDIEFLSLSIEEMLHG